MRRVALVSALTGVLALSLLSLSPGTWAAPWMDPLHQTVPTRTPTSSARTPRPSTPTTEGPEDTLTPSHPTATAEATPTPTITATSKSSATLAPRPSASPAGVSTPPSGDRAWDFGDAPDPGFLSLEANDGARHSIISFEWLGEGVDDESDSHQIDRDLYDDGVFVGELDACTPETMEVEVTVLSRDDLEHPYDAQHLLYLNVLVDWNGDGSWSGRVHCPEGKVASEWAVRNLPVDVSSWPDDALSAPVSFVLPVGPITGQVWARFSLSYAEVISGDDWDGRGSFTYGETEDYPLTVSSPPTVTREVPSPTSAMVGAAPTDTTPTTVWPVGPGSWSSSLCVGGSILLAGVALAVAVLALRRRGRTALVVALFAVAVLAVAAFLFYRSGMEPRDGTTGSRQPTVPPTPRERLVPTVVDLAGSVSPSPTAEASWPAPQSAVVTPVPAFVSARDRFGFGVAISGIEQYEVGQLHAGWYLDWSTDPDPAHPGGMEYAQMVNVRGGSIFPGVRDLERTAQLKPGSLWLVGNEPDVLWQDGITPREYARVYHDVYEALKSADPTCQVAIGGVSQPTSLRLEYLDMILNAYRDLYGEMIPVDVWNVHAFILREERGSWGVDIPPGISVDQGRLFEIEDHDSLAIFGQQIVDFRRWMKDRGESDKPLIVSEYGIVMPAEYGFSHERVRDFMYATFDFLITAKDPDLGYPGDDNRLVQRWLWYSLSDTVYPTGNLFDPGTGRITPLGLAYGSYVVSH